MYARPLSASCRLIFRVAASLPYVRQVWRTWDRACCSVPSPLPGYPMSVMMGTATSSASARSDSDAYGSASIAAPSRQPIGTRHASIAARASRKAPP
eukprot:3039307-Pleurochrysis_carterae.AAC.1